MALQQRRSWRAHTAGATGAQEVTQGERCRGRVAAGATGAQGLGHRQKGRSQGAEGLTSRDKAAH
jgi:hypothetical protein